MIVKLQFLLVFYLKYLKHIQNNHILMITTLSDPHDYLLIHKAVLMIKTGGNLNNKRRLFDSNINCSIFYSIIIMKKRSRQYQVHSNISALTIQLKKHQKIQEMAMLLLIKKVSNILRNQANLIKIQSPCIVVGDIHGQFYDLLNIFHTFGSPPQKKYLFLGDYIDRGTFSVEVITLLLVYKLNYPDHICLLRGNHQSRFMTSCFNFREQCLSKYPEIVYDTIMKLFDELPICAIVDEKYFAVHAGISPSIHSIQDIQKIYRFVEVPTQGGMCDLLWSDPTDQNTDCWKPNSNRKCSYYFGVNQVRNFLHFNHLKLLIRGHQVDYAGYKYQKLADHTVSITVFSAPNYSNHNKACVALIYDNTVQLKTFREVEHPIILPRFQNVFQWSFPFISTSATQILKYLAKKKNSLENKENSPQCLKQFGKEYQKLQINYILEALLKQIQNPSAKIKPNPSKNHLHFNNAVIGPKLLDSKKNLHHDPPEQFQQDPFDFQQQIE